MTVTECGDGGRRTGVPSSLRQQHIKPHLLGLSHFHAYLLYQRIVPQYSVTLPLGYMVGMHARVCALDVHQCFPLGTDPNFQAS